MSRNKPLSLLVREPAPSCAALAECLPPLYIIRLILRPSQEFFPTAIQVWEDDEAGFSLDGNSAHPATFGAFAWMEAVVSHCETICRGFSLAIVRLRKRQSASGRAGPSRARRGNSGSPTLLPTGISGPG